MSKETKMTKKKLNVLFAAFECAPFLKTGGLGDVAGALPAAVKSDDVDVRVILPLLSQIPHEYKEKMYYVENYFIPLGWRDQYCGLFTLEKDGVKYYFLDNEYYFKRASIYGEYDDGERVAFFSKAVLETVRHIAGDFAPDVIHANDWHTALIPVFLREQYNGDPLYDNIKTVFTIHNLKFQGQYDPRMTGDVLGLKGTPAEGQMIHDDAVNFLQGAVIYSDAVTTVSPTYADEICGVECGEGLEGLFQSRRYKLSGIINGIDRNEYDPATDKALKFNYDPQGGIEALKESKRKNKIELQKELGLAEDPDAPLFAMVGRLTKQKGANLLSDFLPEIWQRYMQVAVLGTGDHEYEEALGSFAYGSEGKVAARIDFDEGLARRMYAGADVFLMPSQFEPCGLAQMIAMRYGTLPLVRETGGLKDTVTGYWDAGEKANGFSFKNYDMVGLRNCIDLALDLWFNHEKSWAKLQQNALAMNYGWDQSAEEYRKLYKGIRP